MYALIKWCYKNTYIHTLLTLSYYIYFPYPGLDRIINILIRFHLTYTLWNLGIYNILKIDLIYFFTHIIWIYPARIQTGLFDKS